MEEIKEVLFKIKYVVKERRYAAQILIDDKDDYVLTPTTLRRLEGEVDACDDIMYELYKIAESYGIKI